MTEEMSNKVERVRIPAAPPPNPCDGCNECSMRCTAGIQITKKEFEEIVAYLRTLDPDRVVRVMEQEKEVPWFEDIFRECCIFLDVHKQDCLIYPARPLICRLFGQVEWLPCPAEKKTRQIRGGLDIIRDYSKEIRKTFPEWQMETGYFDIRLMLKQD